MWILGYGEPGLRGDSMQGPRSDTCPLLVCGCVVTKKKGPIGAGGGVWGARGLEAWCASDDLGWRG
jgi:hypothetical protein